MRQAFAIFFLILFSLTLNSFAQNIPTPKPKIYCQEKDQWMTPEEYSRNCRRSAPSSMSPRALSPNEQIKLQILQAMLQPIFNSLFDFSNLFGSSATRRDITERQKEEEKKAIEAWKNYLLKAEEQAKKEAVSRREAGEEILRKAGIGSKLSSSTILGSKTSEKETSLFPIDWNNPRPTIISPGASQVYTDSAKEQLLKTAYFSKMAEVCMLNGDLEAARFWATVAFEGTSVSPRDITYNPPKELMDAMDTHKALEMNKRLTQYSRFFREALPKFDLFESILVKVNQVKVQKEQYEKKIKEIEGQIKKLEYEKEAAQKPEEKENLSDLLSRAIALKEEAEAEYQRVLDEEQRILKEKQTIEQQLDELKNRLISELR